MDSVEFWIKMRAWEFIASLILAVVLLVVVYVGGALLLKIAQWSDSRKMKKDRKERDKNG